MLALREKHRWRDAPFIASTISALAYALADRGATGEAEELYEEALDLRRQFGPAQVVYSLRDYGEHLLGRGEFERAEPLLRELCELEPRVRPRGSWWIESAKCSLGRCLAEQSRFAEAEPLLRAPCESMLADPDAKPSSAASAASWVAEMYEDWNAAEPDLDRAALASAWRARTTTMER